MTTDKAETTCCVVGGGPAGMMLGYLLARAGVSTIVLEKHKDFFRDFRGDTVHPSTLELMNDLGLLDAFLKLPHQRLSTAGGVFGDFPFQIADFTHLPTHCKFIALMPQWDFLDFLSSRARQYPSFDLRMQHEATGLMKENGRVVGVQVRTPDGDREIRANLVVGCDGRRAITRQAAGFEVQEFGVPIDVLWFRISRTGSDPEQLLGNFNYGGALILIPRNDYFQAGFLVRKNSLEEWKRNGIQAFRDTIHRIAPYLGNRMQEIRDWEQISLLSVQINRLRRWYAPGILCIGDAAHAMSPVGGVGINLAIQDAVAAARLLTRPLRDDAVTESVLQRVQKRREFPTRVTQYLQMNAHQVMDRVFQSQQPLHAPWQFKTVVRIPGVQRVVGRAVGLGVRPERVAGTKERRPLRTLWHTSLAFLTGFLVATLAINRTKHS